MRQRVVCRLIEKARARWSRLTARRPAPYATLSSYFGEGDDRRPTPMVTFTLEDRRVDWGDFEHAVRAAEAVFARGDPAQAQVTLRGVRVEAHPGFWTAPAEARALDWSLVVEAFKIAKRAG